MKSFPAPDERIIAVLAHLSAIAFGAGILLPVVGWGNQRRKSNYASFQCLQALGYQSMGYTIWFLSYLLVLTIYMLFGVVVFGSIGESGGKVSVIVGIWTTVLLVLSLGFFGGYLLLPVIAAVACSLGKDFYYPIMGNRLARYLGYDPAHKSEEQPWLIEGHEDRWVTAMGHFSVILPLWGMLAPLTVWILEGGRNFFLKIQSIQTLAYQAVATTLSFGAGFVYLFGFSVFFSTAGINGTTSLNSSAGMLGVIALGISLLVAFAVLLLMPLLHILGQWAGYRVLKGDDYRYPFIGRLVASRLSKNPNSHVEEKLL